MSVPIAVSRPQLLASEVIARLDKAGAKPAPMRILVIRGYFKKSMGLKEKNDRRIYDDACFLALADGTVKSFNFNADPSGYRPGHGTGTYKGMATLHEGLYNVHVMRKHKGKYNALCQDAGPVVVRRDADHLVPEKDIIEIEGDRYYLHKGNFGINLHMGGATGTSSEGCLTWPQSQYWEAMDDIYSVMRVKNMKTMQVLVERN